MEPSGKGVRVKFTGWSADPFVASADKIRIIYQSVRGKKVEFTAETMPGGEIRIRVTDRPVMQGRRIAFRLGERDEEGIANLSIQGSKSLFQKPYAVVRLRGRLYRNRSRYFAPVSRRSIN